MPVRDNLIFQIISTRCLIHITAKLNLEFFNTKFFSIPQTQHRGYDVVQYCPHVDS